MTHYQFLSLITRQCHPSHITRVGPHSPPWFSPSYWRWCSIRAQFLQECSNRSYNYRGVQEKWGMLCPALSLFLLIVDKVVWHSSFLPSFSFFLSLSLCLFPCHSLYFSVHTHTHTFILILSILLPLYHHIDYIWEWVRIHHRNCEGKYHETRNLQKNSTGRETNNRSKISFFIHWTGEQNNNCNCNCNFLWNQIIELEFLIKFSVNKLMVHITNFRSDPC